MEVADARTAATRLINAYRQSQCARVFVELGLPKLLESGPANAAELAGATGAHEPSLRRLLRALVAMEVVVEDPSGRFALTPVGRELGEDRLGPAARQYGREPHVRSWANLDYSVRTGERAFDHVHGMRNWDYYAADPEAGALFDAAMRAMTGPVAAAVVQAYDFSRFGLVADIGGGDGTLLGAVLRAAPGLRGVLFDRPDVVERARERLDQLGVADRCTLVGGSFLETGSIPAGADAYLMKSILHDWEDTSSGVILRNIRAAADQDATLLVIERVLPAVVSPGDLDALLADVNMMVNNGGLERTEEDYRTLFSDAGFRLDRVIATGTPISVLEAVAVELK